MAHGVAASGAERSPVQAAQPSAPVAAAACNMLPIYKIVDAHQGLVAIGKDATSHVRMLKSDLDACFATGGTPHGFALKLVGALFSRAELAMSNVNGTKHTKPDGTMVFKSALDKRQNTNLPGHFRVTWN